MSKIDMVRKSVYISEIPMGGIMEIFYEGVIIARRKGNKAAEYILEEQKG